MVLLICFSCSLLGQGICICTKMHIAVIRPQEQKGRAYISHFHTVKRKLSSTKHFKVQWHIKQILWKEKIPSFYTQKHNVIFFAHYLHSNGAIRALIPHYVRRMHVRSKCFTISVHLPSEQWGIAKARSLLGQVCTVSQVQFVSVLLYRLCSDVENEKYFFKQELKKINFNFNFIKHR